MSVSKTVIETVGKQLNLTEELQKILAEHYVAPSSREVMAVTDDIPFAIAKAQILGMNYAHVMTLVEGVDFVVPTRQDRENSKKPDVTWLSEHADAVFQHCRHAGLQPQLALYDRKDEGRLCSKLTVEWHAASLQEKVDQCKSGPSFFRQHLTELKDQFNTPRQILARASLSGALQELPEVMRKIEFAAFRGHSTVMAFSMFTPYLQGGGSGIPDKAIDIRDFCQCELLGLTAVIASHRAPGSLANGAGDGVRTDIIVSGW